ncbi:MAG: zinc dependent phospholipase C family protein [Defluviitaleaceae bacterium]|nr:zinc dependent phospholipase C family protein [Defluviitaleaceae bacterium]
MPGFLTHYIGGQLVLQAAGTEISNYIKPLDKLFNLGTQGPDIFFYYISGFITKRIRGIGTQMHDRDLGRYFMYLADFLKQSKSPAQKQILFAYVAGFLVHYAVDVHTHGYVYGNTKADTGMKEASLHRHFETSIDVLMLNRMYGRKPGDYKQWQLISPKKVYLRVAAAAMGEAIRQVYKLDITPIDVYRAMEHMARLTRYMESNTGRRKRLLGRAEEMTVGSRIISSLIHMQAVPGGRDYLNIQKAPWSAPWAPEISHTSSFIELFESAIDDGANMVRAIYGYMGDTTSREEFSAIIMNRSLKTGQHTETPVIS